MLKLSSLGLKFALGICLGIVPQMIAVNPASAVAKYNFEFTTFLAVKNGPSIAEVTKGTITFDSILGNETGKPAQQLVINEITSSSLGSDGDGVEVGVDLLSTPGLIVSQKQANKEFMGEKSPRLISNC
ncbi:MAG: hypothetical protein QNJ34_05615 [Xenococcaceae cyanobacterium MO_188.B29]|nr:hypothetical protein [Xenococcaceae cyanobacterium MO_188.B29]